MTRRLTDALVHPITLASVSAGPAIIERMAHAIAHAKGRDWNRMTRPRQDQCRVQARAALGAIRTADPAIVAATVFYGTVAPSIEDFAVAKEAAKLLPLTSHLDGPDVLADLARDWRQQIEGILQ